MGRSILSDGLRGQEPFPFVWDDVCWKHTTEYFVRDFEAEIGFFVGILGFSINTISPEYAMLTPPSREFFFSFSRANDMNPETPPNAVKCLFMINGIDRVQTDLAARGIAFETSLAPAGGGLYRTRFASPHGIKIELWGTVSEA